MATDLAVQAREVTDKMITAQATMIREVVVASKAVTVTWVAEPLTTAIIKALPHAKTIEVTAVAIMDQDQDQALSMTEIVSKAAEAIAIVTWTETN